MKTLGRLFRIVVWAGLAFVFVRGVVAVVMPAEAAPPPPASPAQESVPTGAETAAILFATEYLSWPGDADPGRMARLRPYLTPDLGDADSWAAGEPQRPQRVLGAWAYGTEELADGRLLVTVAARVEASSLPTAEAAAGPAGTEPATAPAASAEAPAAPAGTPAPAQAAAPVVRTVFLAVPVAQTRGGWAVYDYPTLVAPPTPAALDEPIYHGQPLSDEDGRIQRLLVGFFQAYLNGEGDLTYYLTPETPPPAPLAGFRLDSLGEVTLLQTDSGVWAMAVVVVHDPATGARLTTRYALQLAEESGRWYIQDILQRGG